MNVNKIHLHNNNGKYVSVTFQLHTRDLCSSVCIVNVMLFQIRKMYLCVCVSFTWQIIDVNDIKYPIIQ